MKKTEFYNPNNFNATHSAVAYLLFFAVQLLVSFFIASMMQGKVVDDIAPYECFATVLLGLGMLLIVLLMSFFAKTNAVNGGGFLHRKGLGQDCLMAVVGTVGLVVILSPLADTFSGYFDDIRSYYSLPKPDYSQLFGNGIWTVIYIFILTPLFPAIFEELLFRGVIMRGFQEFGKVTAVVLSALLFALAHGSVDRFVYQFLMGLYLGFLMTETGSIFVSGLTHFTNNLFAEIYAILLNYETTEAMTKNEMLYQNMVSSLTGIFCSILGVCLVVYATVYFVKRTRRDVRQKNGNVRMDAVFLRRDAVLGTVEERKAWFETGELTDKSEERQVFLLGKKQIKINGKSNKTAFYICFTLGLIVAVGLIALDFIAV